jgi:hypothetical protein
MPVIINGELVADNDPRAIAFRHQQQFEADRYRRDLDEQQLRAREAVMGGRPGLPVGQLDQLAEDAPKKSGRNWIYILFMAGFAAASGALAGAIGAAILGGPLQALVQICSLGAFLGGLVYFTLFYKQSLEAGAGLVAGNRNLQNLIGDLQNVDAGDDPMPALKNFLKALTWRTLVFRTLLPLGFFIAGAVLATWILAPAGVSLAAAASTLAVGTAVPLAAALAIPLALLLCCSPCLCCMWCAKRNDNAGWDLDDAHEGGADAAHRRAVANAGGPGPLGALMLLLHGQEPAGELQPLAVAGDEEDDAALAHEDGYRPA